MTDKPHIDYLNPGQWPVYIGFTMCPKSFKREMKRLKISDNSMIAHERAHATTHILDNNGTLCFIVAMVKPKRRSREQIAALVAHEALHIVQEMERELGSAGRFDDESAAYLLQHIVQFCLEHMWGKGRKRATTPT